MILVFIIPSSALNCFLENLCEIDILKFQNNYFTLVSINTKKKTSKTIMIQIFKGSCSAFFPPQIEATSILSIVRSLSKGVGSVE